MKKRAEPAPLEVVHVIKNGRAICRFHPGLAIEWPRGHKWVVDDDVRRATCKPCKEKVAGRKK